MYQKEVKIKDYKGLTIVSPKNSSYYVCKEYPALCVTKIETLEKCIDICIMNGVLPVATVKEEVVEEREMVVLFYFRWILSTPSKLWVALFEGTNTIWKEGTRDYLISKCLENKFNYTLMTKTRKGILKIAKEVRR
ncbi:MAG: hypothetical protein ABIN04_15240 [Ginsengibacter sp.]